MENSSAENGTVLVTTRSMSFMESNPHDPHPSHECAVGMGALV